jgi:uncharacterized RDD family membrane protein YckC
VVAVAGGPQASPDHAGVATPAAWPRHSTAGATTATRSRHGRGPARPARDQHYDDRPGQRPTEPLGGPAQPPQPSPADAQPGSERRSPTPTAPLPDDQAAAPAFAAAGPPREALAGFWRRLVAAFLDWLLVGIVAAAIGDLFGVDAPAPPSADGDGVNVQLAGTGPFILVELAYFTYFHATSAGQSIGNKIMGIRVLDAATGRSLPYVRAFVRALMSSLSALPCFLGFFWMLWEPRKRTWHDIVADSLVVRTTFYPPGEFGRLAR